MVSGERYGSRPLPAVAAGLEQGAEVVGYLALLRSFVAHLEEEKLRRGTLKGLVAPELAGSDRLVSCHHPLGDA